MKSLEYYMSLPYRIEIVPDTDEGGYIVLFPELPGCLNSGETIEDAIRNAKDAKKSWLMAAIEDGMEISEPCE